MKKVIIAAIALTFGCFANTVSANTADIHMVAETDNRTPVKVEDLPEAVRKALASSAYEGWTAVSAYLVEGVAGFILRSDPDKRGREKNGESGQGREFSSINLRF